VQTKRKSSFCVTGIFTQGLKGIEAKTSRKLDPECLAEAIGINENHPVKAKITIEVVQEPCELCGEPATGHQVCHKCGKLICDKCASNYCQGRYCPKCYGEKTRALSKLV
jgi:formylmethanofuran dehydrogenase subunit E